MSGILSFLLNPINQAFLNSKINLYRVETKIEESVANVANSGVITKLSSFGNAFSTENVLMFRVRHVHLDVGPSCAVFNLYFPFGYAECSLQDE